MSDAAVALVTQACRSKFPAAMVPQKFFGMEELSEVSCEGSLQGNTLNVVLHNGSNIELSEITLAVGTQDPIRIDKKWETRYYRVPVDLKPLQSSSVSLNIIIGDGVKYYGPFSARGIRRGDAAPPRSGS
jgi:hypothetical protein